jgi:serine/threonine-protein phosphatase 6 catalytic subunit
MDLDNWVEKLENKQILSEKEVWLLCEATKDIFFEESNVQHVRSPVNVCGDIHG